MEYDYLEFENDSEIVCEIDDSVELSFIYKNNLFYIEYYDVYDEDYFLIEIEDDTLPLTIRNKEITNDEFQNFKNLIGV